MEHLEEFTQAALDCAMWAEDAFDDGGEMSRELEDRIRADCHSFWARCYFYVAATDQTPSQAGHDFWLTRNGHGAGFWDGDWDHTPYAELLTELSNAYGSLELYVGDDGLIYA